MIKTLRIVEGGVGTPMEGVPSLTARLTFKDGREWWMCNPYSHLAQAVATQEPFEAHRIIGMAPKLVTINPAHVASVEKES